MEGCRRVGEGTAGGQPARKLVGAARARRQTALAGDCSPSDLGRWCRLPRWGVLGGVVYVVDTLQITRPQRTTEPCVGYVVDTPTRTPDTCRWSAVRPTIPERRPQPAGAVTRSRRWRARLASDGAVRSVTPASPTSYEQIAEYVRRPVRRPSLPPIGSSPSGAPVGARRYGALVRAEVARSVQSQSRDHACRYGAAAPGWRVNRRTPSGRYGALVPGVAIGAGGYSLPNRAGARNSKQRR